MPSRHRLLSSFLAIALIVLPSALFAVDTDSDGLDDAVETNTGIYVSTSNTGTNPNNADSDGNGAGDWYEVATIDVAPTAAQPTAPNSAAIKPNIPYPLPAPNSTPAASNKAVKVHILSGQSNMVGQGINTFKVRYPRARNRSDVGGNLLWSGNLTNWHAGGQSNGSHTVTFVEAVVSAPAADPEINEATATITGPGEAATVFVRLAAR